jgi:rhodanese-related sulfurtransferase
MFNDGASPEGVVLLDVRTVDEFEEGHIRGALHIPHDQLGDRLAELAAHREHEIVLYCRSGRRVGLAAEVLAAAGFEKLAHLDGDMIAWLEQDLPVERPDAGEPNAR